MKKAAIVPILAVLTALGLFFYCNHTVIDVDESEIFNDNELLNAASCLQKEKINFNKIWYDEAKSQDILKEMGDKDLNNSLALFSSFKKGKVKYNSYVWILERENEADNWNVTESLNYE